MKARLDPMEIEQRVRDDDRASHAPLVSGHRLYKQLGKKSRTRRVLGKNMLMSMCRGALSVNKDEMSAIGIASARVREDERVTRMGRAHSLSLSQKHFPNYWSTPLCYSIQ